jgi:hypothetical protein
MATYQELKQLEGSNTLLAQVEVAVWKTIATIAAESSGTTNHAARVGWANVAIKDAQGEARKILRIALANNSAATIAQINAATDASIQAIVDSSVNLLAGI